jgi:hypothetical protein
MTEKDRTARRTKLTIGTMVCRPESRHDLPNMDLGNAYQILAMIAYTKVQYLIEQMGGVRTNLSELARERFR